MSAYFDNKLLMSLLISVEREKKIYLNIWMNLNIKLGHSILTSSIINTSPFKTFSSGSVLERDCESSEGAKSVLSDN